MRDVDIITCRFISSSCKRVAYCVYSKKKRTWPRTTTTTVDTMSINLSFLETCIFQINIFWVSINESLKCNIITVHTIIKRHGQIFLNSFINKTLQNNSWLLYVIWRLCLKTWCSFRNLQLKVTDRAIKISHTNVLMS